MAALSSAIAYARAQAQTDSNGLTDANAILFANEALVDFHRRLAESGVDASQLQEAYLDGPIPATDGNGSTFLYPTDMLWLKAIEVNYADTSAQNYIMATQVDVANLSGQSSFSWLRKNGSTQAPQFDDRGDWCEVFPAFTSGNNVTRAIRIFYFLRPTEYTATSDTVAYPESLDYRLLGWRIAADYYYSLDKMLEGDAYNLKYEERVKQFISMLARGSQQPIQATPIPLTGWEF